MLHAFVGHLRRCRCPHFKRAKISFHARFGVKLFHQRLVGCGICAIESVRDENADPALVTAFLDWFQTHRGAKPPTLRLYARGAAELLQALGDDVSQWTAHAVRNFVLFRASQCGSPTTQKLITSLRVFLRYLNFRGESRDDLALAIPAVAHWRLAKLPRCLSSEEVNRLIAACDGSDPGRLRDRAIVLLLVRLGLRAGDVAQLRLNDIDWNRGTLQVIGKGRYQVRLPLPQDVGDAMLGYLERRPTISDTDCVFVRSIAPYRPFASGDGVSSVVKHALQRARIEIPDKGAHLLRHTAATEMLRNGVPLEQAGLVLRHRSIDMTAYYAKADVALLKQIAQPWPEVNR
jgi:site-specific recombinase XerD